VIKPLINAALRKTDLREVLAMDFRATNYVKAAHQTSTKYYADSNPYSYNLTNNHPLRQVSANLFLKDSWCGHGCTEDKKAFF